MTPNEASRTALYMALFRALESARGARRRLFDDGLAKYYLPFHLRLLADLSKIPVIHAGISRAIDRQWPGARTSAVARTRLIDDAVREAIAEDARQVVLLGAGYDSRPYRLPGICDVAVFEVDHPFTSARKRRLTQRAIGNLPDNVRFVQTDFNRQHFGTALQQAGYSRQMKTVFVWEGVSNYLAPAAVDETLSFCAQAAAGSRIIFTYIDRRVLDDPRAFPGAERVARLVSDAGERWTFGIDPPQLPTFLRQRGLHLEGDVSAVQYRQRYFKREARKMRGYEFYHAAVAKAVNGAAL